MRKALPWSALGSILALALPACSLCDFPFDLLPPLPSSQCEAFANITQVVATDGGITQVTLGCNQGPGSACDGGVAPPCPTSACVEVDWVGVSSAFNGNCSSNASPVGLAAAAVCTLLPGDSGITETIVTTASVPAPMIVSARLVDAGNALSCDAACASTAVTCLCDAALAGTSGQTCIDLK